jgi:hypothetical protein
MTQLAGTDLDGFAGRAEPTTRDEYGLSPRAKWWVRWSPLFIVLPLLPLVVTARTRAWFYWLVSEDRPVEMLTFVFLMLATYVGARLMWHSRRTGAPAWVWLFYGVFTLGVFVTGMEEIAWGQWLFFFKTPELFDKVNAQHEMTLHNINGMQGHNELFRVAFVVGTAIGITLGRVRAFRHVAASPVLWSWVIIISGQLLADIVNDRVPLGPDYFIDKFTEVIELMIGITAYLYLRLNANKLGLADGRKLLLKRELW